MRAAILREAHQPIDVYHILCTSGSKGNQRSIKGFIRLLVGKSFKWRAHRKAGRIYDLIFLQTVSNRFVRIFQV